MKTNVIAHHSLFRDGEKTALWVVEVGPGGVSFVRWENGMQVEAYALAPPDKAAVFAAAVSQGFEPPRALLRQEIPAV